MRKRSSSWLSVLALLFAGLLLLLAGFLIGFSTDRNFGGWLSSGPVNDKNQSLPDDLDYSSVEELYDYVRDNFDGELSRSKLLDGIKKGLLKATGDPYSEYLNALEADLFWTQLLNQLIGVGIELHLVEGYPTVITPLKGSPAEAAGVQPRDTIVKIDGRETSDMSLFKAASLIRGDEGTEVILTIHRKQTNEHFDLTIVREVINVPEVTFIIQDDIGIISLFRFIPDLPEGEQTVELMQETARSLRQAGVKGVILDMRLNPGGDLESTLGVAGIWLDSDQIVTRIGPIGGEITALKARGEDPPLLADRPLVILVDESSASAAEIVAAALKYHEAGIVVGERTFGKTSVQKLEDLTNGDIVKLTTSHWYAPDGTEVEGGLTVDVEISNDSETEADEQLEKALQILQVND